MFATNVRQELLSVKVAADYEKLNTIERRAFARETILRFTTVVNSPEFLQCFLEEMQDIHGELSEYKDHSPAELYRYFMDGSEKLSPEVDGVINLEIDDYYSFKRVIAYTKKHIKTIFVNTKYFDNTTHCAAGSNFCHEYGHKKGFLHDFWATARRPFSICYKINRAFERAYAMIYGAPTPAPRVSWWRRLLRWL